MWNKKAVSGTISALFVVMLFLLVATSILSYRFAEDRYNSLVNDRAQRDWERYNERLTISSAVRTSTDGTLNASIQNVGAVTAHLVTLFLSAYDASNSSQWQRQYAINIWIGPGTLTYHFGQPSFRYTLITPGQIGETKTKIDVAIENFTYVIRLVTERGNIAIYILEPPRVAWQPQAVVVVPGTMRINWVNPSVEANWVRPYVHYMVLFDQIPLSNFYVRAKFVNNWNQPITIQKGTILMQICSAPANSKVLAFGGHLYAGPETWNPGQEVTIVFQCNSYSWNNKGQLEALFSIGGSQVPWTGSAAFTSNRPTSGQTFYSAAVLIDGLLVYQ
jgi:hypothetical protein